MPRNPPTPGLLGLLGSVFAGLAGFAGFVGLAGLAACGHAASPAQPVARNTDGGAAAPVSSRITAFAVSIENLNVDKVGLRDGFFKPDGTRDLAFTVTIDGPFDAIFVVSCNQKGEPGYGLRADTLSNNQEIPTELGGVIDTGKMTIGIGVVEGGKFINSENGAAHGGPGIHSLSLYTANTATLAPGSYVRAYIKAPGGTLVPGPIAPY